MAKTVATESVRRAKGPVDVKMSCAAGLKMVYRTGHGRAARSVSGRVSEMYKSEVKDLVTKLMALVEHRRGKTVKRADIQFVIANGGPVQSFLPAE